MEKSHTNRRISKRSWRSQRAWLRSSKASSRRKISSAFARVSSRSGSTARTSTTSSCLPKRSEIWTSRISRTSTGNHALSFRGFSRKRIHKPNLRNRSARKIHNLLAAVPLLILTSTHHAGAFDAQITTITASLPTMTNCWSLSEVSTRSR